MTTDIDFEIEIIASRASVYKGNDVTEIGDVYLQNTRRYAKKMMEGYGSKRFKILRDYHYKIYKAANEEIKRRFLTGKLISIPDETVTNVDNESTKGLLS